MKDRKYPINRPSLRILRAGYDAQLPLDAPKVDAVRKKGRKREWDEAMPELSKENTDD